MLATQQHKAQSCGKQGCFNQVVAELQRGVRPTDCSDGLRQRLLVLAGRLKQVQAMGIAAPVEFSPYAKSILEQANGRAD
jgi:hypothetical protein